MHIGPTRLASFFASEARAKVNPTQVEFAKDALVVLPAPQSDAVPPLPMRGSALPRNRQQAHGRPLCMLRRSIHLHRHCLTAFATTIGEGGRSNPLGLQTYTYGDSLMRK